MLPSSAGSYTGKVTDSPPIPAPDRREQRSEQRTRRPGGWRPVPLVLAGLVAVLGLFGPALFGRALLGRIGGPYRITAASVSGPLWAPQLHGLSVSGPCLKIRAGTAGVHLASLDPFARTARLDLSLNHAVADLNLKALLGKAGGPGGGLSLLPGHIDIRDTRVNLDGSGFDVPSGSWTVQSGRAGGQDSLSIQGATTHGALSALVKYAAVGGELRGSADIRADATLLNQYWHEKKVGGVTGGHVTGTYTFGGGPVHGDLRLSSAGLAVPGASFVRVDGIHGTLTQRGDLITLGLAGRGWNGPATAQGSVDLKRQHWELQAQAAPLVSALAKSLGQSGKGSLSLRAHASGWNTVTVGADIGGGPGEFSILPYRQLRAHYEYRRDARSERANRLTFSADTTLQGQQRLSGKWDFNRAGTLAWTGELLGKPLALRGSIDAKNTIAGQGSALGGPLSARLALASRAVQLSASPDFNSLKGDLTASGTLSRLNLRLENGSAGPVALAGTARLDEQGFRADLGALQLRLNRQFRGGWTAQQFDAAGAALSGSGSLNVPSGDLSGQLTARVPLLDRPASGPLRLNWLRRAASWRFPGGQLDWRDQTFRLRAHELAASGFRVGGDVTLTTALRASGQLSATSAAVALTAQGLGDRLAFQAQTGGVTVLGETALRAGFPTTARVPGSDLRAALTVEGGGVKVQLVTPGQRAQGVLRGQDWDASGTVNLAALRPLLGRNAGDLSGVARLNLQGQGGTVAVDANAFGARLNGLFTRRNGTFTTNSTLSYDAGNGTSARTTLSGRVFPDVQLSGPVFIRNPASGPQRLQAGVFGPYGRLSAALDGRLTPITLAGLTLPAQPLQLRATLTPKLAVTGRSGTLNLGFDGRTFTLNGTQALSGLRNTGSVTLNGSWAAGWRGQLDAQGVLGPYRVALDGPWQRLNTSLQGPYQLRAGGTLDARTQTYDLSVRGAISGLYVQGRVAGQGARPVGSFQLASGGPSQLAPGVSASLSLKDGGLGFQLVTPGQRAQGVLRGQNWDASGTVNLTALRPLLGRNAGDLSGVARLNLQGQGGTVQLDANAFGARLNGLFTRQNGVFTTNSTLTYDAGSGTNARTTLSGRIFPDVQLSGPVFIRNPASGPQTFQANIAGPYSDLRAAASGRLSTLTVAGLSVPAQPLTLRARLFLASAAPMRTLGRSPALTLNGSYGDLRLSYAGGALEVRGTQALSGLGNTGSVTLNGSWAAGWRGQLNAQGVLGPYRVALNGPWQRLNTSLQGPYALRAGGTLDAQTQGYDLSVRGAVSGLYVQGRVAGQGAKPVGNLTVSDAAGGTAQVHLSGLGDFTVRASDLSVAGQRLRGQLAAAGGLLSGQLTAGPLSIRARGGAFAAEGSLLGHTLSASGRLTLPGTLSGLQLKVDGPYLSARASGSGAGLRGSVLLKAQRAELQGRTLAQLPAQVLPLSATLFPPALDLGGLRYDGGWHGQTTLLYRLSGTSGRLRLVGDAARLSALPSGPLDGSLQLLPSLTGQLSAPLAPLAAYIPAPLRPGVVNGADLAKTRPALSLGRLQASILPGRAALSLLGTRYDGQPLGLNAQISWSGGGLRASGTLTHPGTRLSFAYSGQDLDVSGPLSAAALRPLLAGQLPGRLGGSTLLKLHLPGLSFEKASASARIDLRAALAGGPDQTARGTLRLAGGQLSGELSSDLGGQRLALSGSFYPRADARLGWQDLRAQLIGDVRTAARLELSGSYAGRAVALHAQGGLLPARLDVQGQLAGLDVTVQASNTRRALADLGAWTLGGTFSAPDLLPLVGIGGNISGTVAGSLAELRLNAAGRAAGADFTLPAVYRSGVLSVQGAAVVVDGRAWARPSSASLPGQDSGPLVAARISGTVLPALALSGPLTLSDYLAGTYTLAVSGPLSKPQLRLSGRTTGGPRGLDAPGSTLQASLIGSEWRLSAVGERFGGGAHGRLGTGGLGGLEQLRFTLNAPYHAGATTLQLGGTTGWQLGNGFSGDLTVGGRLAGQTLSARLSGHGELRADAALGAASLAGRFPASVLFRPAGTLRLKALDLGALWQRPGLLALGGQGQLNGADWGHLGAMLSGTLNDVSGELSGPVSASYGAGDAALTLSGRRVRASAALKGGEYRATLDSGGAGLARLLPPALGVDALTLRGSARIEGSLGGGLRQIVASGLELCGQQRQLGPFALLGSAQLTPGVVSGDLSGTLLGGRIGLKGNLPAELDLTLSGLKPATFGLDTLDGQVRLSGQLGNPSLGGRLTVTRPELAASVDLGGSLNDPRLHAAADLKGGYSGRVLADLRGLKLSPLQAELHLYGSVGQGGGVASPVASAHDENSARFDLSGQWPRLRGTLEAHLAGLKTPLLGQGSAHEDAWPLALTGDGTGRYALNAGELGSGSLALTLPAGGGLLPEISAALHLTPLPLLAGATGDASFDAAVSGPLSALKLSVQGSAKRAELSGVSVGDLALKLSGPLTGPGAGPNALSGSLTQRGQSVGTLERGELRFQNLLAQGYGLDARASGRATLSGSASARLLLSGAGVSADLQAAYAGGSVSLGGTAAASGFQASLKSTGSLHNGWNGTLDLTGGPAGVLSAPGRFKLSGALAQPLLTGELGVGGAGVRVVASRRAVQLRLVDGPGVQASGVLNLDLVQSLWTGQASYVRPAGSLKVLLSGAANDPQAQLTLTRGGWSAYGTASRAGADLTVSDGVAQGRLRWDGQTLSANLPGLALGGLDISGLAGRLTAVGSLDTRTLDGTARLGLTGASSDYKLPLLDLPLSGDVSADVSSSGGRLKANAALSLPAGTATVLLNQAQAGGPFTGTVQSGLKVNGGTLSSDLTLSSAGLSGTLKAQALNLNLGGLMTRLSGTATLSGQSFTLDASADSRISGENTQVSLSGSGGLADLLPQLAAVAPVRPTGEGYSLRASLSGLDLEGLKVAPNLSGKISGEAAISDGGGTFVLRSGALKVGDTSLSARVSGTLVGGDWRLRGVVGSTQAATSLLSGSLSNGVVSGTFQMSGLPLDAFLSAFSGELPGRGLLTGLARFQFPLADPASGSLNVVAERLTVSSSTPPAPETVTPNPAAAVKKPTTQTPITQTPTTQTPTTQTPITQTLAGSGFIDYANRELKNIDLHLSGAGRWDVTGAYTHERVSVTASFQNTTFTPVLSLIPSLRGLTPSLQGSLSLNVAGSYQRPLANVSGSGLTGSVSGINLNLPTLSGQLQDSGNFTVQARLLAGGSVGADGELTAAGTLETMQLRGLDIRYAGLLAPQGLGRIENVQASVSQVGAGTSGEGFRLDARAGGGLGVGSLTVQGSISPRIDLSLSARNFNLPLSLIYGRESRIDADLNAVAASSDASAPIEVSGAVNVGSLVLGRVNSGDVLPGPSGAGNGTGSGLGGADGRVDYTSPLPEPLTTFPQIQGQQDRPPSPFLSRVRLRDIPIRAPGGIRVDESIARAELSGDLLLSGSGSAPTLSGSVKAIRGSVDLRDNTFSIASGVATFDGASLYPVFNLSAVGNLPLPAGGQVGANLALDGHFVRGQDGTRALSLDTRLSCTSGCVASGLDLSSSNPNAEAQLYSLLAVGTPDLTTLPSNLGTLGTSALKTALNVFVLGELQRNIARALGVDVFRINAALPGENGSSAFGATVTVGSYLTRQLYLQYQVDLTGQGALDATYTTPDNRFTFKASTPIQGLDLSSLRPSFSAAYNVTDRSSLQLGVKSGNSTQVSFGYVFRW